MNLDDLAAFQNLDANHMIAHINALPQQLEDAWNTGMTLDLPAMPKPRAVLLCGMGGSAIASDVIAGYASNICPVPLVVHRDYDLPAWAGGPDTLVVAASHSGNTEETLSAYQQALERGCSTLAVTTGGKLAQMAQAAGAPVWLFKSTSQPRAAAGLSFGLLMAALHRLDVLPDPSADYQEMLSALRSQQESLLPEVPAARNPAKRMAGQMVGRVMVVFGADILVPAARRFKGQINENAKACALFEILPEGNHNTLAGIMNPDGSLSHLMMLFLTGSANHPRNQMRLDFTRQIYMTQGINTDTISAAGEGKLAQVWTVMHFGDYTSYYLAMAYGEDPTPVEVLTVMKEALSSA